jgi:hypothetical protein
MRIYLRYILAPILTLFIGIAIGKLVNDWPKFIINYEIKITDIIKIASTIAVGIFVPFIVKKMIDDKRSKNNNSLDELTGFSKTIENIHNYINELYKNKKIIARDKDYLSIQLDSSDREITELCSFLSENCSKQTSNLLEEMKTSYLNYWRISTSIEVTGSNVRKIEDITFKKISEKYTEINKKIRRVKSEIIKN